MLPTTQKWLGSVATTLLLGGLTTHAFAVSFETNEHIASVTKAFITKNIAIDPDDKLNIIVDSARASRELPTCPTEIEAAFPANMNPENATGIQLSCKGAVTWQTLVPVDVQIYTQVLVAKQMIQAKHEVTDDLVEYAAYNKHRLYNGFFKDKKEVLGQVSAYLITPGTVLTNKNLQAPILIHRNDVVSLTATTKSIAVSMQGIAKSDGILNGVVKVYNPTSKRTVDALVTGSNKADVIG
jgi:flagella basal body P-ring formation protein FlgA